MIHEAKSILSQQIPAICISFNRWRLIHGAALKSFNTRKKPQDRISEINSTIRGALAFSSSLGGYSSI